MIHFVCHFLIPIKNISLQILYHFSQIRIDLMLRIPFDICILSDLFIFFRSCLNFIFQSLIQHRKILSVLLLLSYHLTVEEKSHLADLISASFGGYLLNCVLDSSV